MKTKRFFFTLGITCVILLLTLPFAFASSTDGSCGENVTWRYDGKTKTVTISGTGAMYDYAYDEGIENAAPWMALQSDVEHIVVKNGVTKLGRYMFPWKMKTLDVPASVQTMPLFSLSFSHALERVTIDRRNPNYSCDNVCIYSKDKTKLLYYLNIGHSKTLTIPEGVKIVCESAFDEIVDLEKVIFPHTLTSLEDNAFSLCENLQDLSFGSGFRKWNRNAFVGYNKLRSYTVRGNNRTFRSDANGCLLSRDGTTVIACPPCAKLGNLVLPDGVTTVAAYAFYENGYLKSVTFPKSLKSIQKGAFQGCGKLKEIVIPKTVTGLGKAAFASCASLKSASIKGGQTVLPARLFEGCGKLRTVKLPKTITAINTRAFSGCDKLSDFVLPPKLESIGKEAFSGALHMKELFIPATVSTIGNCAFQYASIEAFNVMPNNAAYCSDENGCLFSKDGLTLLCYPFSRTAEEYVVSNTVKTIGAYAFASVQSLKKITLPEGLIKLGKAAFLGCAFSTITLPEGLTEIPEDCFIASNLQTLCLPRSVRSVGRSAFFNCDNMSKLIVRNPACVFEGMNDEFVGVYYPRELSVFAPVGSCAQALAKKVQLRFIAICNNGHVMQKNVTPAQYRKNGYNQYICLQCGERVKERIPAIRIVKLSKIELKYSGKIRKPKVTVMDQSGKQLQKGTDFKLKWLTDCKSKGNHKVKVIFKGNYAGTVIREFKIV